MRLAMLSRAVTVASLAAVKRALGLGIVQKIIERDCPDVRRPERTA